MYLVPKNDRETLEMGEGIDCSYSFWRGSSRQSNNRLSKSFIFIAAFAADRYRQTFASWGLLKK